MVPVVHEHRLKVTMRAEEEVCTMRLTRRFTLAAGASFAAATAVAPALLWSAAEAATIQPGDDGLYHPDWVRETFKDLREDFEEAKAEGKRLLIMVEQRGCIYCKKMHEEVFTDPRIEKMLREVYFPIQINLHGDLEVIDTDGTVLTEKEATARWRILFTPTLIFMPTELDPMKNAIEQAVAVMPGAFGRSTTLDMLTWVAEERYRDQSEEDFQRYHARKISERANGNNE
jgi:thioredoxin-related protein